MAQISRPFQIAFAGVAVLAAVWLIALRGHSTSPSEPSPPAASQPASHPTSAAGHAASGPTAPGVAGLSKDVEKARGAVKTSERNAHALEQKSAQVSGESTKAPAPAAVKPHTTTAPGAVSAPAATGSQPGSAPTRRSVAGVSARQRAVESVLASGHVALILFWSPHATDDRAAHSAMRTVAKSDHGVTAFQATGQEVATFGSVTRGVQVYGTPTLLVVGKSRQVHVLTGLTDPYAIEQAVAEARSK